MYFPQIDYVSILVLGFCVAFFVKGARLEGRSALMWGGMSLGAWLLAMFVAGGGRLAGVASQALLFLALTGHAYWREREHHSASG
jgi:hypothetical protein